MARQDQEKRILCSGTPIFPDFTYLLPMIYLLYSIMYIYLIYNNLLGLLFSFVNSYFIL